MGKNPKKEREFVAYGLSNRINLER